MHRFIWPLLIFSLLVIATALYFFPQSENIVLKHLEALKAGHIAESYLVLTTKDFQESNSYEQYQQFINRYPILRGYSSLIEGEREKGQQQVYLADSQDEAEVDYQLKQENGLWKIDKISLNHYKKSGHPSSVNLTADMIEPIQKQLQFLKEGEILNAYQGIVAKQFMAKTPFEHFKAFVQANPILTEEAEVDFKEHSLEEGWGIAFVHLQTPTQEAMLEYRLVQEEGRWKILLMRMNTEVIKESNPQIVSLIREELELFQKGDLQKVYETYITKETRGQVSFDRFKEFIDRYPSLTQHTSVNIKEPTIEEGAGRVVAELQTEKGVTELEYQLKQEQGVWKIAGMHILSTPDEPPLETTPLAYKARDLMAIIEQFLAALRTKDLNRAYNYTSKEFQFANTQKDFENFFSSHPQFAESTGSQFEKEIFNNAIATFSGQLFLSENRIMPVEFDLIYQEGNWKILHLYALPAQTPATEAKAKETESRALEFPEIQLGTRIDDDGKILNPSQRFKSHAGDLYASLKVKNGTRGTEITLTLRHVDSDSKMKPITATLTDNGDETLTFLFSPPPKGWPRGSYQLRVASSTQVQKTFTFTVE